MNSEIRLMEDKLSNSLLDKLKEYYQDSEIYHRYLEFKWTQYKNKSDIVVYKMVKDGIAVGWIIYNPDNSTIEDIVVNSEESDDKLIGEMIDALIRRENLVAAVILGEDKQKYHFLVEYGFRPTHSFTMEGFEILRLDLSTAVLLRKLKGYKPRIYKGREIVAVEKVQSTDSYLEVKEGLARLIEKLGGLDKFVRAGQRVVIKPNIVSEHGLQNGEYRGGIVTDPRLVKALVEILLPVAGKIIIAEGSSINRSETSNMFIHYGYEHLLAMDPNKILLIDLNNDQQMEKAIPKGKRMLSRKIPLTIEEADVIISMPVMKVHFAAVVSLSIKNLQGTVPPMEKYMSHFFGLWQNLVNISHLVKPDLIIIDGLCGQEEFGPISGIPKKMDVLIGGTNPVAVDAVTARIMGIEPEDVPACFLACLQGLGSMEMKHIELMGPSLEEVSSPFKRPELNLSGGRDISVHDGQSCPGCRAYLHFVLNKLRREDPCDTSRLLIDRPLDRKVNIFLGPDTECTIDPGQINIFMGICQQHNAHMGIHIPGCPPHSEAIIDEVYSLFPGVVKDKYADGSEEKKLSKMLEDILAIQQEK